MASLDAVMVLVLAEIDRAHEKHGTTFEESNDDKRLRILVEEVGEIARAIEDIETAQAERDYTARSSATADDIVLARAAIAFRRRELLAEVTQVCASAARWLMVEFKEAGDGK